MIHDSHKTQSILLTILISLTALFFPHNANAVTCAPGDIGFDKDGKVVPRGTEAASCLYGSDVVPCQVGEDGCPYGKPVTDLRTNIRIALNVIFGFLGIVVIIMLVYGGFEWLTSMGSEDKVKKGRDTMLWAAAGAVAIAIAWTVASFILYTGRVVGS